MNRVVMLNALGGPSPVYLRWLAWAGQNEQEPILVNNAPDPLIARIEPAVLVVVRTVYTYQPVVLEWCQRSSVGSEIGAYCRAAMESAKCHFEAYERWPSLMSGYPADGVEVTLTGRLVADCDALEAVAVGIGKYLKARET